MKRIVAAVIAAALLIFGVFFSFFSSLWASDWEDTFSDFSGGEFPPSSVVEEGDMNNRIAIVNVEGMMVDTGQESSMFNSQGYDHNLIIESLKEAINDDSVSGILLNVDSPGGGVYESEEIHKYLEEAKEAGKTIYSSMGGQATSGGYYVSAPADQIFASNETMTGSIGVIMESINYGELADNLGIDFETYTSGDMKDMLSGHSEPSEEEEEYVQGMVDTMFQNFVDVVSDGREMSEEDVRDIADGRIYLGEDAVENGLVDEIGYMEDATEALKEEIGGNPQVIEYGYDSGFSNISLNYKVQDLIAQVTGSSDVDRAEEIIQNRQGMQPMYLYVD